MLPSLCDIHVHTRNASPQTSRSPQTIRSADDVEQCSICLRVLSGKSKGTDSTEQLPSCAHTFHVECIRQWILTCAATEREYNCPLCRTNIDHELVMRYRKPKPDPAVFNFTGEEPGTREVLENIRATRREQRAREITV